VDEKSVFGTPIRASQRIGIAIVLVAMFARGFVCFWDVDQYAADPDAYRVISETLGNTGVYGLTTSGGEARPTAFRPPLYPLVLSWFLVDGELSTVAVAALHTLLGCLTVLCTYRASRRLLGEMQHAGASILAASLVLVDPILLRQSTLVMTETLATAISSVVLWWWVRHTHRSRRIGSALILGLLLGLAFLCRPTFLVWGLMLCLATAAAKPHIPVSISWRIGRAAVVAAVLLMTVGCWTMRNARTLGYPVWATTHGGYTLLLANNPMFYDYLRDRPADQTTWNADRFLIAYSHRYDADPTTAAFWATDWDGPGVITVSVTEHEDDNLAYRAAKATISREPGTFLWSCLVRVYRLWTPLPHRTDDRSSIAVLAIGSYYTALYLAIACGLWRLGREIFQPKWWPILTLLATLTLVHAVYWSNIRMRAPAIPALAIIAAAAIRQPEEEQQAS
jgi:4-amino-4-deoxy-L-arabinose transferase-like glycosyltransferase